MVEKIDYLPSLGKSDHLVLKFHFNCFINNNLMLLKSAILTKVITEVVDIFSSQ